jgi:hypothetical protein
MRRRSGIKPKHLAKTSKAKGAQAYPYFFFSGVREISKKRRYAGITTPFNQETRIKTHRAVRIVVPA